MGHASVCGSPTTGTSRRAPTPLSHPATQVSCIPETLTRVAEVSLLNPPRPGSLHTCTCGTASVGAADLAASLQPAVGGTCHAPQAPFDFPGL